MSISSSALPVPTVGKQLSDFSRLKELEDQMTRALFDQPEAVQCVAEMIKRIKTGLYDVAKPRGVLVFAGPTGVGKTELAKMTAHELGVPLFRFDMSEFSESHKVSRFLGSPSGYVNSDRGGELVNKLKSTPACVVLFDEIEKAHPDIYKIFLQLFDEGRLTDSMGREVNATEAVFILTTNLGSHEIHQQMQRGVRDSLDKRIKELCIRTFSTELYNRFDKVVIFRPLSQTAMAKIVEKYLIYLQGTLAKQLSISWDHHVIVYLSALNSDPAMGARDIHRKIREQVLSKLVASRIDGQILQTGVKVCMKVVNGRLELVVLDKGKPAVATQHTPQVIATKDIPKEAIILKDGVVYLDLSAGRPLQHLKGKHVCRLSAHGGDRSYIDNCIKIVEVSSNGEVIYEDNDRFLLRERHRRHCLSPKWNDGAWVPVTPAKNGRAFLENVCTAIDDPDSQENALILVKRIFERLEDDCHLSEGAPFACLREYCIKARKEDALRDVEALEKLVGLCLSVKILSKKPPQDSSSPLLRSKL